ncbi:cysteine-rich repeat secretory protein 38 [Cucurbita maxima]|uniref:Cysteine-rich repeat secretory protein 38 n=1 Tax=Cucurbita maxima TaxID=3661 RepID=A0A6J1IPP5_CUCMA|nr:cysteine-rich repeat secretory protein 38 [Cucurbita maxima]
MIHFFPQTPSLPSILLLISISGLIVPCCSQRYLNCSGTNTARPNLNSGINFLLNSLTSRASSHTFYTETYNGIHGLFLCRGDIPNEACHTCIEGASQQIKVTCSSQTNGTIGFDECMLRYSVVNFFGILETVPRIVLYNSLNQSTIEDRDFIDLALVSNLAQDAANANMMFKEGEVNVGGVDQRFGLAQCTRDIIKRDCEVCLTNLVTFAKGCCLRQRGWRVLAPNCNLRVEAFQFYGIPRPPSLNLDEEGGNRTRIIVISISTVAAAAVLLGMIYASFLWRNKRGKKTKPFA